MVLAKHLYMNIYYVYAYKHPITMKPFYIGKGHADRAMFHSKHATSNYFKNKHFKHTILKIRRELSIEPIIELIADHLLEADALQMEIKLIAKHGRKLFEPNGILCNLTLGGDGISGYKHTVETRLKMSQNKIMTPELREKYRIASTGKISSEETKKKLRAYRHTPERAEKISKALTGIQRSDDFKKNIQLKNSAKWLVTFPDGHQEVIQNRKAFCKDHGMPVSTLQFGCHGWTAIKL